MINNLDIIKCPYCDAEYLPSEIFYPNDYLGKPSHIDKTLSGEIIDVDGKQQTFTEDYVCDKCGKPFRTSVSHCYTIEPLVKKDLTSDFEMPLFNNRIFLKED